MIICVDKSAFCMNKCIDKLFCKEVGKLILVYCYGLMDLVYKLKPVVNCT